MKTAHSTDIEASFTALLASSIHDMKNSLGMVTNSLELFLYDTGRPVDPEQITLLQFEARRINDNLIQLLALYKSENDLLATHIDEHDIEDFLDEVIAQERTIAAAKKIELSSDCDDGLIGYFDRDLIGSVLRNAIHNAIRHTKDSVHVSATEGDGKSVVIKVIDNGAGINEALSADGSPMADTINYKNGGTGLGLHFCTIVARLHTNRDKQGHISLDNRKDGNGAVFSLYLP
jgi:signal transduction histidine kinase